MPTHWGFGGLLAEGGVGPDDVRLVLDDLAGRRIARQSIRPNPLLGALYTTHAPARSLRVARRAHVLDLRSGVDVVWKGFADSRRRAIRKAERSGVEVEQDATGRLLSEHFALLERSEERWAQQQHEPAWLAQWRARFRDTLPKWQAVARHLDGGCRQWVARHDGLPVASIIVLFGVNAHYTRGAMDKDRAGPVRANDLLMWHAIQAACSEGAGAFHLGESGESRSLATYKERFGARPVDYPELRIERLPITRADRTARAAVKRAIRFREP
jgi:lipid II:glycine glycyltransferase (peptidoglycan interpeptide bridge formation enzyme)